MSQDDTSKYEFRAVALRDLEALQGLHAQLNRDEDNIFTRFAANAAMVAFELKRLRKQLIASEHYVCVVAFSGDELIGYCAATIEELPSVFELSHYASVAELFVAEEHRRNKVATQLLARVFATLGERGLQHVEVSSAAAQSAGRGLLESLGLRHQTTTYAFDLAGGSAQDESSEDDSSPDAASVESESVVTPEVSESSETGPEH